MDTRILIVDDDPLFTDLIVEQLGGPGYDLRTATDGKEAFDLLKAEPEAFDIVIMDRNMPRMDGLTCLKAIRADEELKAIPVVMQTISDDNDSIAEGIEAGASYYLGKPTETSLLKAIVRSAIEGAFNRKELEDQIGKLRTGFRLVENACFSLRTLDDVEDVTAMLASGYPDPERVSLGIHELLINGIEHGNLEITYDEKAELLVNNTWKSEIEHRLTLPEFKDRCVTVDYSKTADGITLVVTDQGKGFDPDQYLTFDSDRIFHSHGRGIAMAKSMCFDEMEYQGRGNVVRTLINL